MFVSYEYFCIKSTEKKKNLVALISHLLPNGDIFCWMCMFKQLHF